MASGCHTSDLFKKWREKLGEEEMERRIAVMQEMGLGSSLQEFIKGIEATLEFEKERKNKRKEQQQAAGGRLRGCVACPKTMKARCCDCLLEFYCSKACQEAAWPGHMAACMEVRGEAPPRRAPPHGVGAGAEERGHGQKLQST
jgi:hypothetical protein